MKTASDLQLGDTIYSCYFDEIYGTFHLFRHEVTCITIDLTVKVTVDHHETFEFLRNSTYTLAYGFIYMTSKERVSTFLNSAIEEMGKNIERMLNHTQTLELGDLNESNVDWEDDQDDKDLLEFITSAFD